MKKKAKNTKKVLGIIMTALGSTGVKKSNTKIKKKAKKLAKQVGKNK
ncbi:MAG: hypothetical protein H0V01_06935 [Bacteroidetes bacterium]|nr:hypothetical protein [Bacteroidota bacterium]HET6245947.1 hypothetical protein [Bacteroidia bacterium]